MLQALVIARTVLVLDAVPDLYRDERGTQDERAVPESTGVVGGRAPVALFALKKAPIRIPYANPRCGFSSLEGSLQETGVEYVVLVQVHKPICTQVPCCVDRQVSGVGDAAILLQENGVHLLLFK